MLILVRNGINFVFVKQSPTLPDDDTTEWCAVRIFARAHQSSSQPTSLDISTHTARHFVLTSRMTEPTDSTLRLPHVG